MNSGESAMPVTSMSRRLPFITTDSVAPGVSRWAAAKSAERAISAGACGSGSRPCRR
jgi:hypothetical protein